MFPIQCSRCPRKLSEHEETCPQCDTEAWCKWRADWYVSPLTRYSIGRVPVARRSANVFATASVVHILALVFAASRGYLPHLERQDSAFYLLFLGFFTYEIWAYFHGWTTTIDRYSHEGKPSRTGWRTFGLGLDVAFYLAITRFAWLQ
jgi:hypothetical protein